MPCWYCGKKATVERHDYPGDGRQMCAACNRASEPGGFWDYAPAMVPGWKRPEPIYKPISISEWSHADDDERFDDAARLTAALEES